MQKIPMLDLQTETDEIGSAIFAAVREVIASGQFIMGPQVRAFEAEVAEYIGVQHAVAVNSGTDALVIALRALGIGPGDEVITSPFTFFATGEAISAVGATPVFVDIDPVTFNLDVLAADRAVTRRTKAVLPVHLYGQAVDGQQVRKLASAHGLKVVEDAAQAFGASVDGQTVGAIGDVGCFSFFPSKNLGAYGDGGMLVTDDGDVAELARMLRAHGSRKKYHNELIGYNSRLDELQAAILRVKLPHVDQWNAGRRRAAARYAELLDDVPGLVTPQVQPGREHVFHQYTVRILGGQRDHVHERLADFGVSTMVYYPVPLHRLPMYDQGVTLHEAERAAAEVLSLPIWPQMDAAVQERVAALVRMVLT